MWHICTHRGMHEHIHTYTCVPMHNTTSFSEILSPYTTRTHAYHTYTYVHHTYTHTSHLHTRIPYLQTYTHLLASPTSSTHTTARRDSIRRTRGSQCLLSLRQTDMVSYRQSVRLACLSDSGAPACWRAFGDRRELGGPVSNPRCSFGYFDPL